MLSIITGLIIYSRFSVHDANVNVGTFAIIHVSLYKLDYCPHKKDKDNIIFFKKNQRR